MAELIPMEYRLRVGTRQRLRLWGLIVSGVAVIMTAAASVSVLEERNTANDVTRYQNEVAQRSDLIIKSQELKGKRETLASRMGKIQQLMDDKVLLALLHNTSDSVSSQDELEFIHVKARDTENRDPNVDPNKYTVDLKGITVDTATLAELMSRLGKSKQAPVNVSLESSRHDKFADGTVQRFEILCERISPKTDSVN